MSTWLEKLTISLFLLMGFSAISIAKSEIIPYETSEKITRDCPISGQVNLRLQGTIKNGQLVGFINNNYVMWSVFSGRVNGFINGQSLMLILKEERNEYFLSGWVGSTNIRWTSFGKVFNEFVYCR